MQGEPSHTACSLAPQDGNKFGAQAPAKGLIPHTNGLVPVLVPGRTVPPMHMATSHLPSASARAALPGVSLRAPRAHLASAPPNPFSALPSRRPSTPPRLPPPPTTHAPLSAKHRSTPVNGPRYNTTMRAPSPPIGQEPVLLAPSPWQERELIIRPNCPLARRPPPVPGPVVALSPSAAFLPP